MLKFGKIFLSVVIGCMSLSNLGIECQSYEKFNEKNLYSQCIKTFVRKQKVLNRFNDCMLLCDNIKENMETLELMADKVGRRAFYLSPLHEAIEILAEVNQIHEAFIRSPWEVRIEDKKFYKALKECFNLQYYHLSRVCYTLQKHIEELK